MPLDRNKLKQLYSTLQKGGYSQSYDQFENGFTGNNNYANRKKVYDLLSANGAQIGNSYEDFMKRIYTPGATPQRQAPPQQRRAAAPAKSNNGGSGFQFDPNFGKQSQETFFNGGRQTHVGGKYDPIEAGRRQYRASQANNPTVKRQAAQGNPHAKKAVEQGVKAQKEIEGEEAQSRQRRTGQTPQQQARVDASLQIDPEKASKRIQQKMDEAAYIAETGKELKNPVEIGTKVGENGEVIGDPLIAPTLSRDENGNIQRGANGEPLIGVTSDAERTNAYKQTLVERQKPTIDERIKEAEEERERLEEQLKKRGAELDAKNEGSVWRDLPRGGGAGVHTINSTDVNGRNTDTEYLDLLAAQKKVDEQLRDLKAARDEKTGTFLGGAWRGFRDYAFDLSNWDGGYRDLLTSSSMLRSKYGVPTTKREKAAERSMMENTYKADNAAQEAEDTLGNGYRFMRIGAQSLPFALNFMAGNLTGMTSGIARAGEALGVKAARNIAIKQGANNMLRNLGRSVLRNTGVMLGDLGASTALTTTMQAGQTASDIFNRHVGNVTYDPKTDDYKLENGKSLGRSIYEGVANSTIENYTEMLGEHMHFGKFAKWGLNKIGLGKVSDWFTKVCKTDFMQGVNKYLEMGGFNGYPQEVAEEEVGIPLHAIFDGGNQFSDLKDKRQQLDIVGGMLFSMAGMGAGSLALNAGGKVAHKAGMAIQYQQDQHNLNNADKVASFRLTDEKWQPLKEKIDDTTNDDFGKVMSGILSDKSLAPQEKSAVWDYAQRMLIMRGHNMGQVAATKNGMTDQATNASNESFEAGYNAGSEDLNRIKAAYDNARSQAEQTFSPEDLKKIDDDPVSYLRDLGDGEGSQYTRQAVMEYSNAKTAYDGMIQRAKDDLDSKLQDVNMTIDSHVQSADNGGDGMIHPITMKGQNDNGTDKKAYIISGNVVMTDDGTMVDDKKSSPSIIIRNEDGSIEMTSPDRILSVDEPLDPETERKQAVESVQQQFAQERANEIDGTLGFAEGDNYQVIGSDNAEHSVNVIQDNGDGTVTAVWDGHTDQPVQLSKDDVQQMSDAYRLQQYSQEQEEANQEEKEAESQEQQPDEQEAEDELPAGTPRETISYEPDMEMKPEVGNSVYVTDKDGNMVHGEVTQTDDLEGKYLVRTDKKVNGKLVQPFNQEEILYEVHRMKPQEEESPQIIDSGENGGESGGVNGGENTDEEQKPQRAIDLIPSQEVDDGKGNVRTVHQWEQAEPGDTYDALTEIYHGNADRVKKGIDNRVGKIDKAIKGVQKKMDAIDNSDDFDEVAAQSDQYDQLQQQKDALEQQKKYWQSVSRVPQSRKMEADRRTAEEKAAAKAAQEKAEAEAAEKARQEREQVNGVPDVINDVPADARQRGFRNVNGMVVKRQDNTEGVTGRESNVKFSSTDTAKGHIKVIDADELQPSHVSGQRNPAFFIDEAQPKDRTDTVSSMAAAKIASNLNPEEITGDGSAYQFSAPTVNSRGEVIQGNNRSDALKLMYSSAAFKPAQDAYKQYIADHAEEFGFTPEDVAKIQQMEHPVMVNELGVDDDEAIRLGQMRASDNESGGIERIDPVTTSQKLGTKVSNFASVLLSSPDEDAPLSDVLMQNGAKAVKWLQSQGAISDTAAQSAFDKKGNLTPEVRMDLQNILKQSLFQGGVSDLSTMFDKMPAKAQKAILSTFMRDFDSAESERILPEIQKAIEAWYGCAMANDAFAKASNYKAAKAAMHDWTLQTNLLDDNMPSDKFSNFAMELACRLQGCSMRETQQSLNDFFDLVQGKSQGDLFGGTTMGEQADRQESIRRIFNIEYKPISNNNGKTRSNAVADNGSQSREGRQGSPTDGKGRERAEGGKQPTSSARGTESHDEGTQITHVDTYGHGSRTYITEGGKTTIIFNEGHKVSYHGGEYAVGKRNDDGTYELMSAPNVEAFSNAKAEDMKADTAQHIGNTSSSEKVEAERQGVNTEPTEGQKQAGNYKKGHIKVDGYDITIENPKGSVREKKDANGKVLWRTPMHYDYGYILGTKGTDGDHIDVYLSDNPTSGNVYVVDQIDQKTGKFDEHKVMYGFPSKEAAIDAYKSQYEKGWKVGTVTEVSREDFKKWVDSSKRKTKPFSEYKSVKTVEEPQSVGTGDFGPIYDQFKGKPKEAINFLLKKKDGEAIGALHHKDIGDIDLVWGKEGTGHSDGYGLAKLAKFHPEVLDNLQDILDDMHVTKRTENRVQLESDTHQATVRLTWNDKKKTWLLTAFEKKNSALDNTTDTAKTSDRGKRNDTATPQSTVSEGKDKQSSSKKQEKGEKNNQGQFGLVSDKRMEELKKRLRDKLNNLNMGVDPEVIAIGLELTTGYIDRGIKKFADYAKVMINDLGEVVRPYLKAFYNGVREMPEITSNGLDKEMDDYDTVSRFNVATIGKEGEETHPSILDTAEQVSNEQTVQRAASKVPDEDVQSEQQKLKEEKQEEPVEEKPLVQAAKETGHLVIGGVPGPTDSANEPKPIGHGDFGPIYNQFEGKPKEAFEFITKKKSGDLLNVFHRNDTGGIDLVWGDEKGGLNHIIVKHVGKGKDFETEADAFSKIEDVLKNGKLIQSGQLRYVVSEDGYRVAIRKDYNGNKKNWIVSAVDYNRSKEEKGITTNPTSASHGANGSELAAPGNSTGKDSKNNPNAQENGEKNDVVDKVIAESERRKALAKRIDDIGVDYNVNWPYNLTTQTAKEKNWVITKRQKAGKRSTGAIVKVGFSGDDLYMRTKEGVKRVNNAKDYTAAEIAVRVNLGIGVTTDEARLLGDAILELYQQNDMPISEQPILRPLISSKKKKATSAGQQLDLFGNFAEQQPSKSDDNKAIETTANKNENQLKGKKNDLRGTDELRTEGLQADDHHEGEHTPRQSETTAQGREAADRKGEAESVRRVRSSDDERLRLGNELESEETPDEETEEEPEAAPEHPLNRRNNHAERGVDYAPKGVDDRIEANIKAIELSQQITEEGRAATPDEMKVLRKYSGWGGLGKAFKEKQHPWETDGIAEQLKSLLGDEGYEQAVMSRNSAYFTPANVIDTMWDIARALGFKGGNVLEGSAGIGNIIGLMPQDMSDRSHIQAVEIDSTSGNILSLLYPDAKTDIQGFEKTKIRNGSVDLAITNVPFVTGLHVNDTTGDGDLSRKFGDIHDFCIAKNVRKLKPGGLGIFITSNGTMDKSQKLRDWLVSDGDADVIGAFRLNNETFGGTSVTSDIIVIRKRVNGVKSPMAIDVSKVGVERIGKFQPSRYDDKEEERPIDYNQYFIDHPENMGGKMYLAGEKGDTFRPASKGLYPVSNISQKKRLENWVQKLGEAATAARQQNNEQEPQEDSSSEESKVYESLGKDVKEGSMLVNKDGDLCIATYGQAIPLAVNKNKVKGHTKVECFNDYKKIKDAVQAVLDYQTENSDDKGLKPLLDNLNKAYDNFVKTYGHLNKNVAISFLKNDMDFSGIAALESFKEYNDDKGKRQVKYEKSEIFNHRVVEKETEPHPTTVKDGVITSIYKSGHIDLGYIANELGKSEEDVKKAILDEGLGFEDPVSGETVVSYEYLSGNVREKLRQAQNQNEDGRYNTNIKELQKVIPMNIPAHLIEYSLGSSWLDPELYEQYIQEKTGISVKVRNIDGTWAVNAPDFGLSNEKNRMLGVQSDMCGKTIWGHELIIAAMRNKSIVVQKTVKNYDGTTEIISDKEATRQCGEKIDEIRQDFKDWARAKMQQDPELGKKYEDRYNDQFNNYVPKSIPDNFVPKYFSGATHKITLRPHQAKAAIRGTTQNLMLAHEVGSGKTFTLISTAMEMRRLGTAHKPMVVVQNATVGQFVSSAKFLYPNAKILTLEDKDRNLEGRKAFYAKIKYNDWDMIVIPQSVLNMIPDSEDRQLAFIRSKVEEKERVLEQMSKAGIDDPIMTRRAQKELDDLNDEMNNLSMQIAEKRKKKRDEKKAAVARQNAAVKAQQMLDRKVDDVENFDGMGIDALLVDEAHEYKHLGFATAMQRGVKGIDPSYSSKCQSVYLKCQSIMEKTGGKNIIFATGTPISNTAAEIWTFMKYLMPEDTMKDYGIYYFDDFVRNFGDIANIPEFNTSGKFVQNNRFKGYQNLPELVRIWSSVSDTVLSSEISDLKAKIPEMKGGKAQDIYLPQTRALRSVMKFVREQLEAFEKMSGKEKRENSAIPLKMYGIAKAAAVDPRLVMDNAEDDPHSKTNACVRETLKALDESKKYQGTVAIFADNYQNNHSGFNLFEDIKSKLVKGGVPENQVVVIKPGMTVKKKTDIFDKVNAGQVRVVLGTTATLGTGVNMQERLYTLIHLDAPNRPMDYTQRNGRILRQGNLHKEWGIPVKVIRFGVEDSLDVTAYQRLKTKGVIAESIMHGKDLLKNAMENRTIEEEEDQFGDTVAQLSGSEYALLKQQAERELRKYEGKRKQWEADQVYIHAQKPRLEGQIKAAEQRAKDSEEALNTLAKTNVNQPIVAGKKQFANTEAMGDFIKDFNKKVKASEDELRKSYSSDKAVYELTMKIGGLTFNTRMVLSRKTEQRQGSLFDVIKRDLTYSCPELKLENVPVKGSLLRNALEDITQNVLTGNDFRERKESAESETERLTKELDMIKSREGKPFEYGKELEEAEKKVEDYTKKMKVELDEKQKKYAEMDAEVDEANLGNDQPNTPDEAEEGGILYREVDDDEAARLDNEPTVKVYRAMQEHDGKLYPPMSGRVKKQVKTKKGTMRTKWVWRDPIEVGKWEASEEHPEMANEDGTFTLDKGNGSTINAAYNPYIHTSRTPINDQFSSAWSRPELVTVEVEVPASELTSGYHAEKAKDATGEVEWKSGPVGREMAAQGKPRMVILSRWDKPVRIVPVDEVADEYAKRLAGTGITVPFNTVPPALRDALVAKGVTISEPEKGNAGQASRPSYEEWMKGNTRQRDGNGPYTDEELSMINDPFVRMLGESHRSKRQQKEFANRERQNMYDAVKDMAEKLHLDNVEIVTMSLEMTDRSGKVHHPKGFYNKANDKIIIVIPNHRNIEDALQTLLHEGVAHYGLRQLFGSHFDTFLKNVYEAGDMDVRRRIADLAIRKYQGDFSVATEEYLASLAEDTDFEDMNASWWQKIKHMFLAMLHDLGFDNFAGTHMFTLSDNELRYILWRSYENLKEPGRYRSILGEAEDITMQNHLGVGNYAEDKLERDLRQAYNNLDAAEINYQNYEAKKEEDPFRYNPKTAAIYKESVDFWKDKIAELENKSEPLDTEDEFEKERQEREEDGKISNNSDTNVNNSENVTEPAAWGKKDLMSKAEQVSYGIDPDLLFRDTIDDDDNTARETYNAWADAAITKLREAWQDSMINVKNLQDAVLKQRDEKIEDYENAYNAENRSHGVSRAEAEYFDDVIYKPLLKTVNKTAKEAGVSVGDVTEYMMAKHGLERNRVFAERDANAAWKKYQEQQKAKYDEYAKTHPKGKLTQADFIKKSYDDFFNGYRERDYSGLTALTGTDNVQDAEAEAQRIVADMESRADTSDLWTKTWQATSWTLKKAFDSGIISRDNYDYVSKMFGYYIPLRGWDETTAGDIFDYVGSGAKDTAFSPTLHKAGGRKSQADNPLAYISQMAVSAIVQGNKNKVKQAFFNFVENHPTNLVSVSEMWYRNYGTVTAPDWREDVPYIPENATADEIADIIKKHDEDMEKLKQQGLATKQRGRLHLNVPVKKGQALEHHVEVMLNGKKYIMYINGNPRAAQALNGTRAHRASENSFESSRVANFGRKLAERYTSLSPAFTLSNALRDLTMAAITTLIKEDPKYAIRFRLNVAKLVGPARMFSLMRWYKKLGQSGLNGQNWLSDTQKYFYEFMTQGAETGFTSLKDIEDYKKDMAKEFGNMNQSVINPKRLFRGLKNGLEFANRCIEDMTRFAIYMASRQSGRSIAQSVKDAKNITLNFNRKGSGEMGNSTYRNLQIFINPAIQALQNIVKMAMDHPFKFGGVTGLVALVGVAQPLITQLLAGIFGGGDGDDDDWSPAEEYWKLPTWQRRNNFVFWIPGTKKFGMIPLAQEFRVFHGFGETLSTVLGNHSSENPGLEVLTQAADLLPLDFTGNNGNPLVNVAPTIVQPLLQIGFNTDFTGRPLYKDNDFNKYEPSFQKAYVGTPSWLIKSSQLINEVTGGNDHKQGAWERTKVGQYANNPAVIDHLLKGYYGGLYSFFAQLGGSIMKAASGKTPDVQEVPIVNRVITTPRESQQNGKQQLPDWYFDMVDEAKRTQNELSGYKRDTRDKKEGAFNHIEDMTKSEDFKKGMQINALINIVNQIRAAQPSVAEPKNKEEAETKRELDNGLKTVLGKLNTIRTTGKPLTDDDMNDQ